MWNDVRALNRLTTLLGAVAFLAFMWHLAQWAVARPGFAIRVVQVSAMPATSINHVTVERVARFCVPQIGGTLFTADLGAVRAAFEALPWVRRASVRRQWPDRLLVLIEEHQALARWNDEAGNRFVSVRGEAFNAAGEVVLGASLPLLAGPEGSEREVALHYVEFRERLARIGKQARAVMLSPRQAWTIRLIDGLTLEVGREQAGSTVMSRIERFTAQYAATIGLLATRVDVVDLRYSNGFAARVQGMRSAVANAPAAPMAAQRAKQAATPPVRDRRRTRT